MKLTELLTSHLASEEGFRPYCYRDSLGYFTIGIGRLIDQRKGGGISREEAEYLLANDIDKVSKQLDSSLPWWRELSTTRQVVIASMAFQMGVGTLLTFTSTLRFIRIGDYFSASEAMLDSRWAAQTPARAKRLAAAMRTNDSSNLG